MAKPTGLVVAAKLCYGEAISFAVGGRPSYEGRFRVLVLERAKANSLKGGNNTPLKRALKRAKYRDDTP